jgi:DNA-binding GntR family transcriptional regulator
VPETHGDHETKQGEIAAIAGNMETGGGDSQSERIQKCSRRHTRFCLTKSKWTGTFMEASQSVAESAYEIIRSDIIFGRLPPGEKLKLDRLKKRYGVSVSTLREILTRLASEEFVVAEGQRGFEVAPISSENLQEISELRKLLECYALELSFAAGDVDWEGQVVAAHHKLHQMELRMMSGDETARKQWKQYDWEFHQALIMACGSRELMTAHAAIFDKYLRYQMLSLTFRGDISSREHKALLDAALKRDAKSAQKTLRTHIDGGVSHSLDSEALKELA